jgi:hypothetical protein
MTWNEIERVVMTAKAVKTARKPAKNNGFQERRLGAMETHRKREKEPSYLRLLLRFRLMAKHSDLQAAYGLWTRVCADPEVIRLSMALAAKKNPLYLVSVAEPFKNGARVLASMNERQLSELRRRVGAQ